MLQIVYRLKVRIPCVIHALTILVKRRVICHNSTHANAFSWRRKIVAEYVSNLSVILSWHRRVIDNFRKPWCARRFQSFPGIRNHPENAFCINRLAFRIHGSVVQFLPPTNSIVLTFVLTLRSVQSRIVFVALPRTLQQT